MALAGISVTPDVVNELGKIVESGRTLSRAAAVASGQRVAIDAGLAGLSAEQLRRARIRVDAARVSQ